MRIIFLTIYPNTLRTRCYNFEKKKNVSIIYFCFYVLFAVIVYTVNLVRKQVTLRDEYHNPREIMSAMWSPTDSSLAIIAADYNIYYIPTVVQPNNVIKMTFNGSKDVYNGIPDRMYAGKYIL